MFVQDTQSEQVAAFLADLTKDDSDTFKKRFVEMLAGEPGGLGAAGTAWPKN